MGTDMHNWFQTLREIYLTEYFFSIHSCYNHLVNYNIGFYNCTVLYFTCLKQSISQTVRLLPNPLPDVTVEITPICGKYVTK